MGKFSIPKERKPPFKVRIACPGCGKDEVTAYVGSARGFLERNKDAFPCLFCNRERAKVTFLDADL